MSSFAIFNSNDEDFNIKFVPRTPESTLIVETPSVNGTMVVDDTDRSLSICLSSYEPLYRTSSLTLYYEDIDQYREILFLVDGYPFWFRGTFNSSLYSNQYVNGCEIYISDGYLRIYSYRNSDQDVRVIPFLSSSISPEYESTDSYVYDPLTNVTVATLGGNSGAY